MCCFKRCLGAFALSDVQEPPFVLQKIQNHREKALDTRLTRVQFCLKMRQNQGKVPPASGAVIAVLPIS